MTGTPKYYQEYYAARKAMHPEVPESVWIYFDYNQYLIDLWRSKKIHILYVDDEGIVPLEEAGSVYPVWEGKELTWFIDHPFKHLFYIVEKDQLTQSMTNLATNIHGLRDDILALKEERDNYKTELQRMYHAWDRSDLEEWAAEKDIEITDKMWSDWCNVWMDIYNLQYEQEAMKQAMDDWWESREF